jgi:Flp pilus assembly pilin Flp
MQSPRAVATLLKLANRKLRKEDGQDLLEYAMLVGLIGVFALGAVRVVGDTIYTLIRNKIANNF